MMVVLRIALLVMVGMLMLSTAMALGTSNTGVLEKAALVGVAMVLVVAAWGAHRLGAGRRTT